MQKKGAPRRLAERPLYMAYLSPALGLEPTGGVALVEGLEGSGGIGNLLQEHHGCDGVRLVAGLLTSPCSQETPEMSAGSGCIKMVSCRWQSSP